MTNPNSRQISKMIEVLKDLEISQQDCELAQSYLSGEVGDEVLDQFERKDLTRLSYQFETKARAVTKQIEKENKRLKIFCRKILPARNWTSAVWEK